VNDGRGASREEHRASCTDVMLVTAIHQDNQRIASGRQAFRSNRTAQ